MVLSVPILKHFRVYYPAFNGIILEFLHLMFAKDSDHFNANLRIRLIKNELSFIFPEFLFKRAAFIF